MTPEPHGQIYLMNFITDMYLFVIKHLKAMVALRNSAAWPVHIKVEIFLENKTSLSYGDLQSVHTWHSCLLTLKDSVYPFRNNDNDIVFPECDRFIPEFPDG